MPDHDSTELDQRDTGAPQKPRRRSPSRKSAATVSTSATDELSQTVVQVPDQIVPDATATHPADGASPGDSPVDRTGIAAPDSAADEPTAGGSPLGEQASAEPAAADPALAEITASEPVDAAFGEQAASDALADPAGVDVAGIDVAGIDVAEFGVAEFDPTAVSELTSTNGTAPAEPDFADLVPSTGNLPAETVQYESVVLTDIPVHPDDPQLRPLDGPVDLGDETLGVYRRPGEGVVVTTQQTWTARGVTLGRLLHSLALAPGESTRMAVVDWTRAESGNVKEATSQQELVDAVTRQQRDSSEQAGSTIKEQQAGDSSTESSGESESGGGSFGLSLGFLGGGGGSYSSSNNKAKAKTVSRSSGAREAVLNTTQRITANTQQAASAARDRRASIIRESTQTEGERSSTRVVTNYNHMHAMSVQYYEVVQAYEVTTTPVRIERCVFVPLQVLTFTPALLKRYAPVLAAAAPRGWAERIGAIDPFATAVTKTRSSRDSRLTAGRGQPGGASTGPELTVEAAGQVTMKHLAAAPDGTVWAINQVGVPMRWDPATRSWLPAPTQGLPAEGLTRIAVGNRRRVLAIDAAGVVYQLDETAWSTIPGGLADIACGAEGTTWTDGAVWGVNAEQQVFRVAAGGWEYVDAAPMRRVGMANDGVVWGIRPDGGSSQWNAATKAWEERGGVMVELAVAGDGSVWCVNANHDAFRWTGSSTGWVWQFGDQAGARKFALVAPVSEHDVWALTAPGGHPVRLRYRTADEAFDGHAEEGYADSLTVWWDDELIRGIELSVGGAAGPTYRYGDTASGSLHSRRRELPAGDRVTSVVLQSGTTDGGTDCLRRIVLHTAASSSPVTFGPDVPGPTDDVPLTLRGAGICGMFGTVGRSPNRRFISTLGFSLRGEAIPDAVLDHLNDNADHYSQAVWANADELTLSRILASYSYTPTEPGAPPTATAGPVPLGACVDPQPVGATGNYLAFRWHYPSEQERLDWLATTGLVEGDVASSPRTVVALPSAGVFAEAVLGRSNSAEKLDITRFWNWNDSPLPLTASDIAVTTGTRAMAVDLSSRPLEAQAAQLGQLTTLPEPGLNQAITQSLSGETFRNMAEAAATIASSQQATTTASAGEQAAGQLAQQAFTAALAHQREMTQMAISAAEKMTPQGQGLSALQGAAGGDGLVSSAMSSLTSPAGGRLATASVSEVGGTLNMAQEIDAAAVRTRPRSNARGSR